MGNQNTPAPRTTICNQDTPAPRTVTFASKSPKHQDYQFCTCTQSKGLAFQTPGLSVLYMYTEQGTHVPNTRTISSAHVHRTRDSHFKHQDYQFCTCPQNTGLMFQTPGLSVLHMSTEQGTHVPITRTISSAHVHRTRDSRSKHQDYQFCTCPQNTGLTFQTPGLSVLHMSTEQGTHIPNTGSPFADYERRLPLRIRWTAGPPSGTCNHTRTDQ